MSNESNISSFDEQLAKHIADANTIYKAITPVDPDIVRSDYMTEMVNGWDGDIKFKKQIKIGEKFTVKIDDESNINFSLIIDPHNYALHDHITWENKTLKYRDYSNKIIQEPKKYGPACNKQMRVTIDNTNENHIHVLGSIVDKVPINKLTKMVNIINSYNTHYKDTYFVDFLNAVQKKINAEIQSVIDPLKIDSDKQKYLKYKMKYLKLKQI